MMSATTSSAQTKNSHSVCVEIILKTILHSEEVTQRSGRDLIHVFIVYDVKCMLHSTLYGLYMLCCTLIAAPSFIALQISICYFCITKMDLKHNNINIQLWEMVWQICITHIHTHTHIPVHTPQVYTTALPFSPSKQVRAADHHISSCVQTKICQSSKKQQLLIKRSVPLKKRSYLASTSKVMWH